MSKKLTTEEFIEKARRIHGDKYDYSNVKYLNNKKKVIIVCKTHGEFEQNASSHMIGNGCPKCGQLISNNSKLLTTAKFIKKSTEIHNGKYDYEKSNYINNKTAVCIICPEHGEFWQISAYHMVGNGCPKCANSKKGTNLLQTNFIKRVSKIHNNLYNYDNIVYINNKIKIKIECPKHGFFEQTPKAHLYEKQGCPKCINIISNPEIEVSEFVKSLNLQILTSKRNIIKPYELDIYIPILNKAIEFNGTYWHYSKKHFIPGKHSNKSNLCREKGIKLLHIREDLWNRDKEKMKQIILKFLNT